MQIISKNEVAALVLHPGWGTKTTEDVLDPRGLVLSLLDLVFLLQPQLPVRQSTVAMPRLQP